VTQSIGTARAVNTYFVWLVGTSCRIAKLCSKGWARLYGYPDVEL